MTRKHIRGKRRKDLTPEQIVGLLFRCLTGDDLSPGDERMPVFASREARHACWLAHRDKIMALPRNPGTRPDAWWCYEAPEKPWQGESNRQALDRLGLLTDAEISLFQEIGQWPVEPCPGPDYDPRELLEPKGGGT